MKEIVTVGGVALLGWALYEWLRGNSAVAPGGQTGSSTSATNTSSTAAPVVATAAQLVEAAQVGTNGTLTPQQWNYYWMQITGKTTTFTPTNLAQKITASQYLAMRSAAGLGDFMRSTVLAGRYRTTLTLPGMGGFQASTVLRDRARSGLTLR